MHRPCPAAIGGQPRTITHAAGAAWFLQREGLARLEHFLARSAAPADFVVYAREHVRTMTLLFSAGVVCVLATPWLAASNALATLARLATLAVVFLPWGWMLRNYNTTVPDRFVFPRTEATERLRSLAGGVGPYDHQYKKGEFQQTWHRNEKLLTESGHVTDLITKEACDWLSQRGEKPFFLYVPFTAVHLPVKEPAEWLAKVPAGITGEVARHYAACIMHLDDSVGRIVATLEKTGKRGETLIVFTSDNGGSTAENNGQTYPADDYPAGPLPGNNKPLRNEKGSVYEGGTRVPCIVNWPAKLKPGKHTAPVQIVDWMPTFCALAGFQPDRDLKWDGTNLWPQLAEGAAPASHPIYTVAPGFKSRSFRVGDWKLVIQPKDKIELFDIAKDPKEKNDLASKNPEKVAELQKALEAYARADKDAVADD